MAFGTRTNETDDGGCLPEKRKVHSKNFYGSMLTSNGKDGTVQVLIRMRRPESSTVNSGTRVHEPLSKEAELVKAGDIGKLEA